MIENKNFYHGSIEVICGSMFSGKTEELIKRIKKVELSNQNFIVFRPKTDSRNPKGKIISHANTVISSQLVEKASDILHYSENYPVIGIDEAQFFDQDLVSICNKLANSGHRIIVAGLDMDYKGNPFGPMPNLMACAEKVTKVHAVCVESGEEANYSFRKNINDEQIEQYNVLFKQYFLKSFSSRLAEYSNPEIEVVSKKKINENYTMVSSILVSTEKRPEVKIDWRVYTKNPDKPLIRDLIVEGLSLARTQKEEFASILNSNNNDINILINKLEDFVKN